MRTLKSSRIGIIQKSNDMFLTVRYLSKFVHQILFRVLFQTTRRAYIVGPTIRDIRHIYTIYGIYTICIRIIYYLSWFRDICQICEVFLQGLHCIVGPTTRFAYAPYYLSSFMQQQLLRITVTNLQSVSECSNKQMITGKPN